MTDEELTGEIASLKEVYGEVDVAKVPGGQILVRIHDVTLPRGCSPLSTPVLLALNTGQPRPQIYVKRGIKLSNGVDPRSSSIVAVGSEEWLQFSYSFPWEFGSHTLVQFVGASLQRFAKTE